MKNDLRRIGFISSYAFPYTREVRTGTQERDSEPVTDLEAIKKCCL